MPTHIIVLKEMYLYAFFVETQLLHHLASDLPLSSPQPFLPIAIFLSSFPTSLLLAGLLKPKLP